jgi:hypothetical protein
MTFHLSLKKKRKIREKKRNRQQYVMPAPKENKEICVVFCWFFWFCFVGGCNVVRGE